MEVATNYGDFIGQTVFTPSVVHRNGGNFFLLIHDLSFQTFLG